MRWLLWFLPIRLFLWGVTIFLVWQVVVFVRTKPDLPDPRVVHVLEAATADVVSALKAYERDTKRIGVVHFVNDPTDRVTETFIRVFSAPATWAVDERSVIQRFLGDIGRAVARATTPEEVAFAGRQVELDWVVMGRVHQLSVVDEVALVELSVWIYDLNRGEWMYRERLVRTRDAGQDIESAMSRFWSRPWVRVLTWILVVALLPWLTAPLIYRVIEHKSNALSAILLGAYGAADLLLMLALMGFDVSGRNPAILVAAALLAVTIYNYWACEKIAEETR